MSKYVQRLEGGIAYVASITPRKGAKLHEELQRLLGIPKE
jgi:hypothetical protein